MCQAKIMQRFDSHERWQNSKSTDETKSPTDFSTCPCEVGCYDRNFQSQISSSTWPSNQYWKLLALDVGTYDADDINAGGPKGDLIQQTIKEDFARLLLALKFFLHEFCSEWRFIIKHSMFNQLSRVRSTQ